MRLRDFFTGGGGPAVGDPAPVLRAPDQDGTAVDLREVYAAGQVLIYFYLRAGTPVCTVHACRLRDEFEELRELGVRIIGVSGDRPEALHEFAEAYGLPFRLLSDVGGEIARAFGVPAFFGLPARRAFLVRDGRIVWVGHASKAGREAVRVLAGA